MVPESLSNVGTQLGGAAAKVEGLLINSRESVAVAAATTRLNWRLIFMVCYYPNNLNFLKQVVNNFVYKPLK
jgi:hypothetical protein